MFTITIVPEAVSMGVVASGNRKYNDSNVTYHWEAEILDNGYYWLYIDGDNEGIDFKSMKEIREYLKRL